MLGENYTGSGKNRMKIRLQINSTNGTDAESGKNRMKIR
jgi:hypothetical protein